MLIKCFRTQS